MMSPKLLEPGVRQFQERVQPTLQARFTELAGGQAPKVLFVTCSDSRVDPSLITQAGPGELFIVRNAGNLVPVWGLDDGSAAAVEYAVVALGIDHIVVCGHSGCGAIGGLLNGVDGLPAVGRWVRHAAATKQAVIDVPTETRLATAIRDSAERQLDNLLTHPSVAGAVANRTLSLHAWVYNIESGEIENVAERGVPEPTV